MSLRLKLFLIFGGLIGVLVLAQWLLVRKLTQAIFQEFGVMAVSVGQNMAQAFVYEDIAVAELHPVEETSHGEHKPKERIFVKKTLKRTLKDGHLETTLQIQGSGQFEIIREENEKTGVEHDVVVAGKPEDIKKDEKPLTIVRSGLEVIGKEEQELHWVDGIDPQTLIFKLDHPRDARHLVLETKDYRTRIPLPRRGVSDVLQKVSGYMLAGSLLIFAFGLMGAGYLAHRISKPLAQLSPASREVGSGALGTRAPEPGGFPEIRQAVQAFNSMSSRLQELDEADRLAQKRQYLSELGEIARGLAHTIRNPLNTLGLSLEQLAALAPRQEESRKLVAGSQKQIRRIDRWIRSFLALASEGKGRTERLDVGSLIQDVALEAIQDNLGRVKLDVSVPSGLPHLSGVTPELRAVIQALVINAVEASPMGGTVKIVAVATAEKGIHIEVLDRGQGVPPAVRARLFTPHVTTKAHGSGMGLFLAHRLATGRYRGSLVLQDLEPHGTRAVLELPKGNEYDEDQDSGR